MKIGDFRLKLDETTMRASDIAGAASACPMALHRRECGLQNLWMTPQSRVVD
jgi:hypothetical protein